MKGIFEIETNDLTQMILSMGHKDSLMVSSQNGDDGAYEFYCIHDCIFIFDDNLELIFSVNKNKYELTMSINEIKKWT
jgi:hypothetical protein